MQEELGKSLLTAGKALYMGCWSEDWEGLGRSEDGEKAATEGSLLQTVTWSAEGRCSSGYFSNLLLLSVTLYAIFRMLWKK